MRLIIHMIGISFLLAVFCRVEEGEFGKAIDKGRVDYDAIDEASGLVCSVNHPGYFWTHNDSGDEARLFLLDSSAAYRATYYLEGVEARDWEDIASMKEGEKSYLLVGDIGDNLGRHANIYVHKVEEPLFEGQGRTIDTIPAQSITTYTLRYEDGPKDAESLFFDPVDQKLYIISKRDLHVGLYEAVLPNKQAADTITLRKRISIPYTFITSADISSDGNEVLIKNLLNVYYWKRKPGQSIPEMFQQEGAIQPYEAEAQGEAIAFARDSSGYFTVSERPFGLPAHLYFYERKTAIGNRQ
ncbi:hypothetical protein [Olivibacter sp. XZL3]|uniref:hypothetical protein n=1 Tax=Olivibacter sp. XZL3 TaxID=1735116 RepID=UPI00106675BF|nr:hypothetical protein [Olivibacter sp. XZL3]